MKISVFTLILVSFALSAPGMPPDVKTCDLDVLYISRAPRCLPYQVNYSLPGKPDEPWLFKVGPDGRPAQMTPEEIAAVKRWPDEGETVTFTAVVENKGTVASPPFEYAWFLDGKRAAEGKTEAGLAPGERKEFTFEWPWRFERHLVGFWADPMRRVGQLSVATDTRTVWTHAKLLRCIVDSVTYKSFAENRNVVGTYSFEDWCQEHADWMNHLWAESVYPTAPNGVLERVSVDTIILAEDEAAMQKLGSTIENGYDGGWWFGRNADCSGLIHEWGHQFGLTDLYALDVGASTTLVLDASGSPLLIGHSSVFAGTMMHGHGPVLFSEDQAIALNHQLWRRRGYYGDYYYNIAPKSFVEVHDSAGRPVPRAALRFWQRGMQTGTFEGEPTLTGTTDAAGRFLLPNRPAPHVVTDGTKGGGYELRANPFGHIHVVGVNGVMLVEITARGQTDYAWLEIPQLNVATARGDGTTAAVVLDTPLPVEDAASAPKAPTVALEGDKARVTLEGARHWVVMRADPDTWNWRAVAEVDGETYVDTLPHSGLYRYAACTKSGSTLSARSSYYVVAAMRDPWGLALAPDGMVFVRDRPALQTLMLRPDGSAVGFIGSVHWHLEGSSDHATDKTGRLYVAKWPDGYDPKRSWIRRINPRVEIAEGQRRDLAGGEYASDDPGRFLKPMGIWVSPDDGTIVVADTGNNRIQILDADGHVKGPVVTGFKEPYKALLAGGYLVVCDTGAKRVAVLAPQDQGWREVASFDGFEQPTYCCIGQSDHVWIADRGLGRVFALAFYQGAWRRLDVSFPSARQPKIDDLRGIAYDAERGDLLYLDGTLKPLVRVHVQD
jgi:hypothetical protein